MTSEVGDGGGIHAARAQTAHAPVAQGYSDRVNHAFAFAAKHHDRQVRRGAALPYPTHPANVALILTRYGCDEETVLAGILHNVVGDSVRDGMARDDLEERVGKKFGTRVLATVLAISERRADEQGVEMSSDERRADLLARLAEADEGARWVCAADAVHNGSTILADLKRTSFPEAVWGRLSRGPEATVEWYRRVHDGLAGVGFRAPIMKELHEVAQALSNALSATS